MHGETVPLFQASESYFGLAALGTRPWQLLNQGQGKAPIVDTFLAEHEVERPILGKDIKMLIDRLVDADLMEIF